MKSKRSIIAVMILVVGLVIIACIGMFRDFDAQGYVHGVLDLRFRGEVDEYMEFSDAYTEKELYQNFEDGMTSFVENNISNNIEMSDEAKQQYKELCKEIFAKMKYEVQPAEKISRKEYHVTVAYQPVDVFSRFIDAASKEQERLWTKVDKSEYTGTDEEIMQQMQQEYIANAYEHLKTALSQMQYGQEQKITFIVKKNDQGVFVIEQAKIDELFVKIMGLDKIQD